MREDGVPNMPHEGGGDEAMDGPSTPKASHKTLLTSVRQNLAALKRIKSWFLQSMALCMQDPGAATAKLREMVATICDKHPDFSTLTSALGIDAEPHIDWGSLGQRLEASEKEQQAIEKDLALAGATRKRRGRPFGSKNIQTKPATDGSGQEEGPLMTPPKKRKQGSSRKRLGKGQAMLGADPGSEVGAEGEPEVQTDPFHDCEEKDANKGTTIPLYSKCLVVKLAKELLEKGNVHSVEKEVMTRFRKYFWSVESSRWKTGLLHKWIKHLVRFSKLCYSPCVVAPYLSRYVFDQLGQ